MIEEYDKAVDSALERGEDPSEYLRWKTGQDEFEALLEKYWQALQGAT